MFKWIFKHLILPILILLAIPVTLIALAYKPLDNPLAEIEDSGNVSVMTRIDEALSLFLEDETGEESVVISMTEDEINGLLLDALRGNNPNYLEGEDYVIEEDLFGYAGSWVELSENELSVVSKADIFVPLGDNPFTFQTALTISFEIDINLDTISLKLTSLKLGNLGLLWIYDAANFLMKQVSDTDLEAIVNDTFAGFGYFDSDERSVEINIKDLIQTQLEGDDVTSALVEEALVFIKSAELIEVGPVEDAFALTLHLEKLRLESLPTAYDPASIPQDEAAFQAIFSDLFDPYIIMGSLIESTLTTETVTPYVDLNETVLNQLIGYVVKDMATDGVLFNQDIDLYNIQVMTPIIEMDGSMTIYIPITFGKATHSLQTAIIIDATPSLVNNDLVFTFDSIALGTIDLETTLIDSVIAFIGDNEFIQDNTLVIADIGALFGATGVTLESITVKEDKLRIAVNVSETLDVATITETVDTILDVLSTSEDIPESVKQATSDVLAAASNGDSAAVEEAVETFIEVFDTLTEEEQTALAETITNILEESEITFDSIFDLLPGA